jgi:hypothetical protein
MIRSPFFVALLLLDGLSLAQAPLRDSAPAGAVVLDPDKQKRIWDLEHSSFVLENYFGKAFAAALVKRDAPRMIALVRDDFGGTVLDPSGGEIRTASLVEERSRRAGTVGLVDVNRAEFVEHLFRSLEGMTEIRSHSFKVLFIDAPAREGDPWRATIRIEVIGRAADGGPIESISEYRAGFAFAAEEEVKSEAPVLARADAVSEVWRSSPRLLMEEVTEATGLADLSLPDNWEVSADSVRGHRYQLAVEDSDRDGWLDIAIGSIDGRPFLMRSLEGKRFDNVASSVGLKVADASPRQVELHALANWIDYDNDGYPDLLLGYRLYHNDKGKRFTDVTAASGLVFDRVPFGCAVADYDNDGRLDLYIAYQKGFKVRPPGRRPWVGDPHAGAENHLWRNMGGGKFRNVTKQSGAAAGRHQTFAAASFHFDDDLAPDLYLANDFGTNVLLRNRGDGTFEDVTGTTGTGDYSTSMGVAAGDLDNDGSNEIYVANMYSKQGRRVVAQLDRSDYPEGIYDMIIGSLAGNRLYRRSAAGSSYDELSLALGVNTVGWAHGPAMVDLDGNGWLDLYATAGYNSTDRAKPDG